MTTDDNEKPGHQLRRTVKQYGPEPVDIHVGGQLRLARERLGLTQSDLAHSLNVSFQLIQKYENGRCRVSASRLFQLTRLLNCSVAYIFDEPAVHSEAISNPQHAEIELVKSYRALKDSALRKSIQTLMKELGNVRPIAKKDRKRRH